VGADGIHLRVDLINYCLALFHVIAVRMTGVLKTPSGMFEEKDDGALLIIAAAIQVYLLRSFQETF
jgi:hypothetical protein